MKTNNSDTKDIFGGIAAVGSRRETSGKGNEQRKTADWLPLDQAENSVRIELPSYSEERLQGELDSMRENFRPFFRSLAPAPDWVRPRQLLGTWDYRLIGDTCPPFQDLQEGKGEWQRVTLPHYGGPVGKAFAIYRTTLRADSALVGCARQHLVFRGADYHARVYLDGRCLGEHEGFFAPFRFDVTGLLHPGREHTLLVELRNDEVGEKIYAATGPGWDDPQLGWHHCPPGMGLWQDVFIEGLGEPHVADLSLRTLSLEGEVEILMALKADSKELPPMQARVEIFGENFECLPSAVPTDPLTPSPVTGLNEYRLRFRIPEVKLWDLSTPWLYRIRATLARPDGSIIDHRDLVAGVRMISLETESEPKGRFLLNGREIRLRGANTMGFEQQDVMRGEIDQLRDDLLLAKVCGMNFLRFTQRPVQSEIYAMCDRIGLLAQVDFPLFGVLKRSKFEEALRQVGEMVRFVRAHPSLALITYINEPYEPLPQYPPERFVTRAELEMFFRAADEVARLHLPDVVIKAADGDYDPPGPGLMDEHCYTLWYVGHLVDAGALHAGEWPDEKPGWNVACGEFGAEGLDYVDLMRRRYPAEWLQPDAKGRWSPDQIIRAQSGKYHGYFFDTPSSLEEWVEESQAHQARATRWMTEAFRRNPRMVSFAIHLFIDAWPSGWMKAIMDCERKPKPAFFAYQHALAPTFVSLRTDRFTAHADETLEIEAWICRDDAVSSRPAAAIRYSFSVEGETVAGGSVPADCPPCSSRLVGLIGWKVPAVKDRTRVEVRLEALDESGTSLHANSLDLEIFPQIPPPAGCPDVLGQTEDRATRLVRGIFGGKKPDAKTAVLVCDDPAALEGAREQTLQQVEAGARLILLDWPVGSHSPAPGVSFTIEKCAMGERNFVSVRTDHPLVKGFRGRDFFNWYSADSGHIAPLLATCVTGVGGRDIITTPQAHWDRVKVEPAAAVREFSLGKGSVVVCQLRLDDRLMNPAASEFAQRLLNISSPTPV